jgi:2-polyprenyl-3-methyl-5-hydroxy-6-metoxy-1,4-benzoquinol methylase
MENVKSTVKDDLSELGLISGDSVKLFSDKTSDRKDLPVFKCQKSGVIFIEDYYVGDTEYTSGTYQRATAVKDSFEDLRDVKRRARLFGPLVANKDIFDFGCGLGHFLNEVKSSAKSVSGIDLQESCLQNLRQNQILAFKSLSDLPETYDVALMLHSFEHLPSPLDSLKEIKSKLKSGGKIVVEVPHARDALITLFNCQPFIDFTLWSQHLILHTRESLNGFLVAAGFTNIVIEGVQRYGLSNHLNWLANGTPGGHRGPFATGENLETESAYSSYLARMDANDTLVAIAEA